jgi:Ca2+:H+ antiporter
MPNSLSARRLYNSFTKFSLPIGIGLSILFFSLSTALYFVQRGSLAEFFLAIITFLLISSLSRYVTKDLVIRLQRNDYELLAGILNGFFGNIAELCFVLMAVVRREPIIA